MNFEERRKKSPGEPAVGRDATSPPRRPYRQPRLDCLGDVRDLTLGGTPGTGDSPDPANTQSPFGP